MPGFGAFVATRTTGGAYVEGVFQPGDPQRLPFWACIEPLDGRDLLRFPEGERTKDRIRIYTAFELKTADTGQQADLISFRGKTYQIESCLTWAPFGKYIAVSTGDGA